MVRIMDQYSNEAFQKIVAESTSVFQVAVALGYTKSTHSAHLVTERIKAQNLDISHFITSKHKSPGQVMNL